MNEDLLMRRITERLQEDLLCLKGSWSGTLMRHIWGIQYKILSKKWTTIDVNGNDDHKISCFKPESLVLMVYKCLNSKGYFLWHSTRPKSLWYFRFRSKRCKHRWKFKSENEDDIDIEIQFNIKLVFLFLLFLCSKIFNFTLRESFKKVNVP